MKEIATLLTRWEVTPMFARQQVYQAATPRERERWHALWLLTLGWTAQQVATALERDPHTIGEWLAAFERAGPAALAFTQAGGAPPP